MIYLTRRYHFSASHRLHNPRLSKAENQAIYGKCNNELGHGHNYSLEVTVVGEPAAETGMVVNLAELDAFVAREILDRFHLTCLNTDVPNFRHNVPSSENLCVEIFRLLQQGFGFARIDRVRLRETSRNALEYTGEKGDPG